MCMRWMSRRMKKMSWVDVGLVKWSVAACVLFVLSWILIYPNVSAFIIKWKWLWLGLFVLFALKPLIRAFSRSKVERIKTRKRK